MSLGDQSQHSNKRNNEGRETALEENVSSQQERSKDRAPSGNEREVIHPDPYIFMRTGLLLVQCGIVFDHFCLVLARTPDPLLLGIKADLGRTPSAAIPLQD